jgi:hypothetical protein
MPHSLQGIVNRSVFYTLRFPIIGKRRLNFASFTTKERLNFPLPSSYHIDIIALINFLLENSTLISDKY